MSIRKWQRNVEGNSRRSYQEWGSLAQMRGSMRSFLDILFQSDCSGTRTRSSWHCINFSPMHLTEVDCMQCQELRSWSCGFNFIFRGGNAFPAFRSLENRPRTRSIEFKNGSLKIYRSFIDAEKALPPRKRKFKSQISIKPTSGATPFVTKRRRPTTPGGCPSSGFQRRRDNRYV